MGRLPLPLRLLALALLTSLAAAAPASARPIAAPSAVTLPAPVACPGCWRPALRTSWQWQLASVPKAPFLPVRMYDVDGFEAGSGMVTKLHQQPGRRVVCYISAGSWESWRPDASQFPTAIRGKGLDGWPGERWLDIRRYQGTLGAIMQARLDMCAAKGFDAVEFDNVDGYLNASGFALTAADQLVYNAWLANEAHARGLSAVLKNDMPQIPKLLPYYDMALNEQCWQYSECTTAQNGSYGYNQFIRAGKAVFQVEYSLAPSSFCPRSNRHNFNSLRKKLLLGPYRVPCRGS
ncbi:MAG: hypothetical protein QOF08_3038 [Gaiellales bacterium]|jgi:hypothetical protein|nr:hypothetical protein [Gaiellales bacterium]